MEKNRRIKALKESKPKNSKQLEFTHGKCEHTERERERDLQLDPCKQLGDQG